jgi:hypothetical protein
MVLRLLSRRDFTADDCAEHFLDLREIVVSLKTTPELAPVPK